MQPVCLTSHARRLPLAPQPLFQQKRSLNNNISQGLLPVGVFSSQEDGWKDKNTPTCACSYLPKALGVEIPVFQGKESPELPVTKLTD